MGFSDVIVENFDALIVVFLLLMLYIAYQIGELRRDLRDLEEDILSELKEINNKLSL